MDGGAAAPGALLLRAVVLVLAGPARGRGRSGSGRVDAGGEQGVRGGARDDRPERARQVGDGRADAAHEDGCRRGEPLQGPRERRRLHRGRARAVPALQQLVRVHPGLGLRRRRRRRRRFQARLLPQTRPRPGPGAEEGRPVDGGRAQVVPDGAEEVRERGLEEHLAQIRDEPDADAGGQPRAKVLHPAQLRRQGQTPLQHPRHHHRQPARRRPRQPLPIAAVRARPRRPGPVRRPRRREASAPAVARRAPALHVPAATGVARYLQPPLRQREARAEELARGRHGSRPRRFRPSADAMRAVVTAVHGAAKTAYGGEYNGVSSHPRA